jgi:Zn-dependent protease with chaperone function
MRRSRRLVASLIGLGLGVAGCDTVSTASAVEPASRSPMPVLPHDAAIFIFGLSLATLALIVASIARHAIAHDRLAGRLGRAARPAVIEGRPVGLVPGQRVALVAGLRRPRTFLSSDVVDSLSLAELAAVVAHERHHQLRRAPVTLVALHGATAVLGWARPVARWAERVRAQIEIDADAHALAHGSSRRAIAQAIVKLSDPPISTGIAGFGSAVDIRLRALLHEEAPLAPTWRDDVALVVGLASVVVVICSALSV